MQWHRSWREHLVPAGLLLLVLVAAGTWQPAAALHSREQHIQKTLHWPRRSTVAKAAHHGGDLRNIRGRGLRAFLAGPHCPTTGAEPGPGAALVGAGVLRVGVSAGAHGGTAMSSGLLRAAVDAAKPASLAVFDVTSYGAKGNGLKDNWGPLMAAFNASCASSAQGIPSVLLVPAAAGLYRFRRALHLMGPCGTARLSMQIDGFLYFDAYATRDPANEALLEISFMKGFTIHGSGTLHGRGASWWSRGSQRPHLLQIDHSSSVRVLGLNFRSVSGGTGTSTWRQVEIPVLQPPILYPA